MRAQRSIFAFLALLLSTSAWAGLSPRQIFRAQGPAVVLIMATDPGLDSTNNGTGSVIRADGLVLTNAHVIMNRAEKRPYKELAVFLKPEKLSGDTSQDLKHQYEAELVRFDADLDLAVLKIVKPPKELGVIVLGDCDDVLPGDQAVAIGHPEQGGLWTLTTGAISSQIADQGGIEGKHVFQVEASINRGNSGGPLLDERGYLIGVNSSIARRATDGLAITGVNFALKSSVAKKFLDKGKLGVPYGSLGHDDSAIAKAYGFAPPATPTALPTAAPTAVPTAVPTQQAAAAPAATAVPSPVPTTAPTPVVRAKRSFRMDLQQKPRPYKAEQLSAHFKKLKAKRNAAMDELEKEVE